MALMQTVLNYRRREKTAILNALREKANELKNRSDDLKKRETDLENDINAMPADADQETKTAVEQAVEELTAQMADLEQEVADNAAEIASVEADVERIDDEIEAIQVTPPAPDPAPTETNNRNNERSYTHMRVRAFERMNVQERTALVQRDEVKTFISRARDIITRGIQNVEITIPQIVLPMIREEVERESKMLRYVNHMTVPGEGRMPIMGEIPEAIWTEQCAKLNELDLSMYLTTFSAYKVGAFYGVCRYVVEDSDENILDLLMYALAVGIARAVDKAILFGTGKNMPVGIVTRLIQTADPGTGDQYSPAWVDLSASNVVSISASDSKDKKLIQMIAGAFGKVNHKTGTSMKFFAMNEATHMKLMTETISYTSSGALVSAVDSKMPVLGGDIVIVEEIPDNIIVAGYGVNYAMLERGSMSFATSDQVRWIEEQILVKATARYDGKPVNPAAFIAIGIDGAVPATAAATVTFAPDRANAAA